MREPSLLKGLKVLGFHILNGGVFLLMHNVFLHLNILSSSIPFHGKVQHYYSINETVIHLGKNFLMTDAEQLLGGFWFLKSLFWGSLFFFSYTKDY